MHQLIFSKWSKLWTHWRATEHWINYGLFSFAEKSKLLADAIMRYDQNGKFWISSDILTLQKKRIETQKNEVFWSKHKNMSFAKQQKRNNFWKSKVHFKQIVCIFYRHFCIHWSTQNTHIQLKMLKKKSTGMYFQSFFIMSIA